MFVELVVIGSLILRGTDPNAASCNTTSHPFTASLHVSKSRMSPLMKLKLLDFTDVCGDPDETTPFEMLSIAISFLFTANNNAYAIIQALADQARGMGYDGVIYPSFFNQIREKEYKNIALFGRPVEEGKVRVECVNRLVLNSAQYSFVLGPAFHD